MLNACIAYYPQVVDIPLIKEKGDLRIDAGVFSAPNLRGAGDGGAHGTISYGLTNSLAIQSYACMDGASRVHLQGALGLFKGFENKTVIEMYGGYGYGSCYWSSLFTARDNYQLVFSQFNIGKTDLGAAHIDYGLGLKGGYLFVKYEPEKDPQTIHQENGYIIEPSIFFRFGGRIVKFCTKVNYLWTKTVSDEYYLPLCISMGVNISL